MGEEGVGEQLLPGTPDRGVLARTRVRDNR